MAQGFLAADCFLPVPESEFLTVWPELQKTANCLLVEEDQSVDVLAQFQSLPGDIKLSQACDSVLFTGGKWWVRDFWGLALKESLVKRVARLDTHGVAYLTGDLGRAKSSLAVLSQLGFKKIHWVTEDTENLRTDRERFMKNFFGIELTLLRGDELTLQPNNGTVLINTLSDPESESESESQLLQNLIYLNFLQRGGAVVDAQVMPLKNQLLDEAESVGVHSVPGWHLEGTRDYLLLPHLTAKPLPELENYLKDWHEFLKTRPTSSQK